MAEGNYDVGYGKPPRSTRFAPGQSGNPSGRRNPKPSLSQTLDRILAERVKVTEGGQQRRLTKEEVFLRQMVNKAIAGDRQFAALMLGYLRERQVSSIGDRGSDTDAFLLDELRRMVPNSGEGE